MDGTIGTQTTMPFGNPEDVRACVRERIETLGKDGALILSPTHVLEPEVPWENIPKLLPKVRPIHEYVKVDAFIPGCPPAPAAIWHAIVGLLTETPAKEAVAMTYD